MSRRLIRLYNEQKEILQAFANHPYISIKNTSGNPPEIYQIEYRIKGLEQKGKTIVERNSHLCEINLPSGYPREMPICRPLTPVFHPNISPSVICIADQWAAGESLAGIIVRIGEMICYQNYNIKSPRNGEAARWAEKNIAKFPLDTADLSIELRSEEITTESEVEKLKSIIEQQQASEKEKIEITVCSNCGVKGENIQFHKCLNEHLVCPECTVACQTCGKSLCILCTLNRCSVCGKIICVECLITCSSCKQIICKDHLLKCSSCGREGCPQCITGVFSTKHFSANDSLCSACASKMNKNIRITYEDLKDSEIDKQLALKTQTKMTGNEASVSHYCAKCGHTMTDINAKFCEMCGQKFKT